MLDLAAYTTVHFPAFQLPRFLELVISKLESVERGEIKRLILSLPLRHGKSLVASTYFPAWFLGRNPDRYVIASSYGQELADDCQAVPHCPTHARSRVTATYAATWPRSPRNS